MLMKCKNCGSRWQIGEHLCMTIRTCPFCGYFLEQAEVEEKLQYGQSLVGYTNRNDLDIVGTFIRGYHGSESDVYIPEGVEETGPILPEQGAFYANGTIRKLVFPKSMRKIGTRACYDCINLQEVIIPEGVTTISEYAFSGCTSLKQIKLPSTICTIGKNAFAQSGLVSIQFPTYLDKIEWSVFEGCGNLEEVIIPGTVKEIGDYAFRGCSNLRFLDIQNGVRIIRPSAFEACTALTKVELPYGLEEIGHRAFKDCFYLTTISIPESVQKIEVYTPYYGPAEGPFMNCTGLYNIKHPARFGAYAFIGSGYYDTARKLDEERMARERQRIRADRLNSGKCPDCDMKLSRLGRKCPKCGKRY